MCKHSFLQLHESERACRCGSLASKRSAGILGCKAAPPEGCSSADCEFDNLASLADVQHMCWIFVLYTCQLLLSSYLQCKFGWRALSTTSGRELLPLLSKMQSNARGRNLKKMQSRWLWKVATWRLLKLGSWWNSEASMRPNRWPSRVSKWFRISSGFMCAARPCPCNPPQNGLRDYSQNTESRSHYSISE